MTKNIFIAIVFSVFTNSFLNAQVKLHSHWDFTTKKISDCEYDLIFTVMLDKGWHTFSINKIKDAEEEVFPTQIIFTPTNNYSLTGNLTETKPTSEYDATIKKTVLLHYNKVVFVQRIKLKSADKIKISGTYQNQACKDVCETAPKRNFDFDLKGSASCSKKK
jgi:hypothetical protein